MVDHGKMAAADAEARPASEERGELTLTLDGAEMVLRPSYEAIEAFENGTGRSLNELALLAAERKLKLSEASIIVCECVRAWGRATNNRNWAGANSRRIAELILEADGGVTMVTPIVAGVLALAATGKYTAQGELKPVTMMTTEAAPVAG